jgi:thioesterase domain-containing protein
VNEDLATLTPAAVVVRLQALGFELRCDAGRLVVSAPPGVLTICLQEQIERREPELVAVLDLLERGYGPTRVLMPIQPRGTRRAFFACPGHNGDVFCFVRLARHLGAEQPFYALQPPGLDGRFKCPARVEDLAALFVDALVIFQPRGAFLLGGFCHGGTIAFEMARQLRERQREVDLLVLMGSDCPTARRPVQLLIAALLHRNERVLHHLQALRSLRAGQWKGYVWGRLKAQKPPARPPASDDSRHRHAVALDLEQAFHRHRDRLLPYAGTLTLFIPSRRWMKSAASRPLDWARFAEAGTEVVVGPDTSHVERMLLEPDVQIFARHLLTCLDRSIRPDSLRPGAA